MVEAVGTYRRRGASDDTGMRGAPEEMQMGETFIFSETIKDLKTLRSQLYSAAEYFERAYMQEDGKQAVVSNLKEYAVKALVNTVDHLGSISFKVSSLVGQRFDEVAEANLRVSCIQQRTQTSQASMNREGLTQQSLVITAPKYHKRYILPGNNSIPNAVPNFSEMNKVKNRTAQMHPAFSSATSAAQTKSKDKQASFRKLRSISRAPSQRARSSSPAQHTRFVPPSDTAIPTKRDKRSDSPIFSTTPLTRSGSLSKKPSLLKTSSVRVQTTSDPKRLAPLRSYADRYNDDPKESEQTPKKSKKFLKSLLSRRKSKKEEPLPCYFDDY